MLSDGERIDRIYEAAVALDRWPELLCDLARDHGAAGALVFTRSPANAHTIAARGSERIVQDYLDGGWFRDPVTAPFLRELAPGFRTATDYYSAAVADAFPVHRDFLIPRGLMADVSTIIQGANDDMLQLTVFGFPSHDAARRKIARFDTLRPHLARALTLSSQLVAARAQTTVASLALGGVAAAIVAGDGRLKAMNAPFAARLGDRCDTRRHRLHFADPFLDRQFAQQLATGIAADRQLRSIATHVAPGEPPIVVHLLPLRGAAREVADSDGVLLILADGSNVSVPDADLLRLLFDLTPAEARLTRLIAQGISVADAAQRLGVAANTARVHLRAIFSKTGAGRQAELVAMLGGLRMERGAPEKPGAAPP